MLCIDGARRGIREASAGSALIAYLPSGEELLLCRSGRLLGHLDSAFDAEVLALELGLESHKSFLDETD